MASAWRTSSSSGLSESLPGKPNSGQERCNGGNWVCNSPVLIDVDGRGIRLTGCDEAVSFDLHGSGSSGWWTWTPSGAGEAWLALDRNGNGIIDDGTELFGSATPQAPSDTEPPNGFRALAVLDEPANGGNGDGLISAEDAVFSQLVLWADSNQSGATEAAEMTLLANSNIVALDLAHQEVGRRDQHGNYYRYRARAYTNGAKPLWTWDVFLVDCSEQ